MSYTKTFTKNDKGKIEFTENELKSLLDKVYQTGREDERGKTFTYRTPSALYWWDTAPVITCNSVSSAITNSYLSTATTSDKVTL